MGPSIRFHPPRRTTVSPTRFQTSTRWLVTFIAALSATHGISTAVDGISTAADAIDMAADGQTPRRLYKEFTYQSRGDRDWRITDDEAVKAFPRAKDHLPNATLNIRIDDLKHAVAAEAVLDRWGGHRGTTNKRIRFNGHDWIGVPEIDNLPDGIRGEQLMYQDNPTVPIPIDHLVEGDNAFEGDCDESGGFGWGQWGLYAMVVRVYYDAEAKNVADEEFPCGRFNIRGKITAPISGATIGNRPMITVDATAAMGVARIDLMARYDDYDEDGDGDHGGYHGTRFQLSDGGDNDLRNHIATIYSQPYRAVWNTDWIADQTDGAIAIVANIQDSRGYWMTTPIVDGLTLRRNHSVRIHHARGVPEDFSVRVGETKTCEIVIDDKNLPSATGARLHLRTWHGWDGHHEPLRINGHPILIGGKNHFYDYDQLAFDPAWLRPGKNEFKIHSKTEHHMLEVLWPGPSIAVRYDTPKPNATLNDAAAIIRRGVYEGRDHFIVRCGQSTVYFDIAGGGLSRWIDGDGNDWIAFRRQFWNDYPAAAASSFRGMPNLILNDPHGGFGHPGHDAATSRQTAADTITATTRDGLITAEYRFDDRGVDISIRCNDSRPYWFLYEGPIAGRFNPASQYFATDRDAPDAIEADFYAEQRWTGDVDWVYMGDRDVPRVLSILDLSDDDATTDMIAQLGNTTDGVDSPDGMVVMGFGRGPDGIDPQLTGSRQFRVEMIERAGDDAHQYAAIADVLNDRRSAKMAELKSNDASQ